MTPRRTKAFTLLELIVVVVVLGVLALLAVPTFHTVISRSHDATSEASLRAIGHDIQANAALDHAGVITAGDVAAAVGETQAFADSPGLSASAEGLTTAAVTAPGSVSYSPLGAGAVRVGLAVVSGSGDIVYALVDLSQVQTWVGPALSATTSASGSDALAGPQSSGPSPTTASPSTTAVAGGATGAYVLSIAAGTPGTPLTYSGGFTAPSGPADTASLRGPQALAFDASGNMYIADSEFIEKVDTSGTITTLAGNGLYGNPTPGPAVSSQLPAASAIAATSDGTLYVAAGNYVLKIASSGVLSVVAGDGTYSGAGLSDGAATSQSIGTPTAVAVDSSGTVYFATRVNGNGNAEVASVAPDGQLQVLAGTASPANYQTPSSGTPALSAELGAVPSLAVGPGGSLYIDDMGAGELYILTGGVLNAYLGNGGVPNTVSYPGRGISSVAVDTAGDVFVTDPGVVKIFEVSPAGTVTAIAGTGTAGVEVAGAATSSNMAAPQGLAVGAGKLAFADPSSWVVALLSPAS